MASIKRQAPVGFSTVFAPKGHWPTALAFLCARFAHIAQDEWRYRFAQNWVLGHDLVPLNVSDCYRSNTHIYYKKHIANEVVMAYDYDIVYCDSRIVVVDKPHFLPVVPAGRFVEQTLQHQLQKQLSNPYLTPVHRLDRETAGLVLFTTEPHYRSAYHALFSKRLIGKVYEAIAPLPSACMLEKIQKLSMNKRSMDFLPIKSANDLESIGRMKIFQRFEGMVWVYCSVLEPANEFFRMQNQPHSAQLWACDETHALSVLQPWQSTGLEANFNTGETGIAVINMRLTEGLNHKNTINQPVIDTLSLDSKRLSITKIKIQEIQENKAKYTLEPLTGRKHQLRVHMAALGCPIDNDTLYPRVLKSADDLHDDNNAPLQLLAKRLQFLDPYTGRAHCFESKQNLIF